MHVRNYIIFLSLICLALRCFAHTGGNASEKPIITDNVRLIFEDKTWFTDSMASLVIEIPCKVTNPEIEYDRNAPVYFMGFESAPSPHKKLTKVFINWYPKEPGLVVFPSIKIHTPTEIYQTHSRQIQVSLPFKSDEMDLTFIPEKTEVYAGEPVKINVIWKTKLSSKRIRSLNCYPSFFNDKRVEIALPNHNIPETEQLGLPFGGKRIIAKRTMLDRAEELGIIEFPVYLRFPGAGTFTFDKTRLECAHLKADRGELAPYAAYYNNGLFEPVERGIAYDRIFTTSNEITFNVKPLPELNKTASFCGWFTPCDVEVEVNPQTCDVGQIIDLDIHIKSQVASDFIAEPHVATSKGQCTWFKFNEDWSRIWCDDGVIFSTRIRPLSTEIQQIPSFRFQVFNPEVGEYECLSTKAIPLKVNEKNGKTFFDVKKLHRTDTNLTDQLEGIWHNQDSKLMNDILNHLVILLTDYFWLLIVSAPVGFLLLLPIVRERRKRANNHHYKSIVEAYNHFKAAPEYSEKKWMFLVRLIAVSFKKEPASWTIGNSRKELMNVGISKNDFDIICKYHESVNSQNFSGSHYAGNRPQLAETGKNIFHLLKKLSVIVLVSSVLIPLKMDASAWEEANQQFTVAINSRKGSEESIKLFSEAALKYESIARQKNKPGVAFYNAGNSWFQAGKIGRSIACYKQAKVYRPFDHLITQNLNAARALTSDVLTEQEYSFFRHIPIRWLAAVLVLTNFFFWVALLFVIRYQNRPFVIISSVFGVTGVIIVILMILVSVRNDTSGVVIVEEVFARKGPGYQYLTAFREPLHEGLEFRLINTEHNWIQIELADGRHCWIPESQTTLIRNNLSDVLL